MGYQIIPNIVFVLSVCGIILIILKNLSGISELAGSNQNTESQDFLAKKGLPIIEISKIKIFVNFWAKKIWNFILEAKDLRHTTATGYKIKKILQRKTVAIPENVVTNKAEPVASEQIFIDKIKENPKDLENYDGLGSLYLAQENFEEAKDTYTYLTSHASGNADYFAKLAFVEYKLKNYKEAGEAYKKSLALDSTHPNRYYNLGLSYKMLGDSAQATEAFSKALELEPKNPKYQTALKNIS